jgi:beta-lactamase class A
VRDLGTGATAAYNAGAHFPAASTIKLGILLGVLARDRGDPLRSSSWPLERSLVLESSNAAANALLPRAGGATAVDSLLRGLGATATFTCCGYLLEPGERASATRRARRDPLPPAAIVDQPTFPCCKYTTAHDLGTLLVTLMLASTGHGAGPRLGISAREARVALWMLVHAAYPGLVRPSSPFPVGHKAGWLPTMQHDAALVFSPRGTLVAVFMNYSPGGVSYSRVRIAAGAAVRLALRRG